MVPLSIGATTGRVPLINPAPEDLTETYIHVPTLLSAGLAMLLSFRLLIERRLRVPTEFAYALGFVLVATLAGLVGLIRGGDHFVVIYLIQTVLPLSAFVLGIFSRRDPRAIARGIMLGGILNAVLAVYFAGGVRPGGDTVERVASYIPQFRNLLPPTIMAALLFAIAFRRHERRLAIATIAFCSLFLPLLWSRSALVVLIAGGLVLLVAEMRVSPGRMGSSAAARASRNTGLLIIAIGTIGSVVDLTLGGVLGDRGEAGLFGGGDETRLNVAAEAVGRIIRSPLFGDSFLPVGNVRAGGQNAAVEILFPSHNQYLDYAIRGGVLLSALFLLLLVGSIRRSYKMSLSVGIVGAYGRAALGTLAGVALGAAFQLYFVHGITASILWFLVGYSCRLSLDHNRVHHVRIARAVYGPIT